MILQSLAGLPAFLVAAAELRSPSPRNRAGADEHRVQHQP